MALVHGGSTPPGNWFAPTGSNQSSGGGTRLLKPLVQRVAKATWRACRP